MTEFAQLRRMAGGDTHALGQIIEQYTPYVSAVIHRVLGDRFSGADEEELAADVFYALWVHRKEIRGGSLKGWLGCTARNKAINRLRERGITVPLEEDQLEGTTESPEQLMTRAEQTAVVQAALADMGQPDREIFLRHYYYCQTVRVIGAEMKLNESTVKSRLARGRMKLKRQLEQGGYFHEDQ